MRNLGGTVQSERKNTITITNNRPYTIENNEELQKGVLVYLQKNIPIDSESHNLSTPVQAAGSHHCWSAGIPLPISPMFILCVSTELTNLCVCT